MNTAKIEEGTILTYSYNYNCQRPQFLRVTKKTPSFVYVESLSKQVSSGDWMNGYEMPVLNCRPFQIEGRFKIIKSSYFGECIKIDGHIAEIWDGKPRISYCD